MGWWSVCGSWAGIPGGGGSGGEVPAALAAAIGPRHLSHTYPEYSPWRSPSNSGSADTASLPAPSVWAAAAATSSRPAVTVASEADRMVRHPCTPAGVRFLPAAAQRSWGTSAICACNGQARLKRAVPQCRLAIRCMQAAAEAAFTFCGRVLVCSMGTSLLRLVALLV